MPIWHCEASPTSTSGAEPDESGFIPGLRAWLCRALQEARPRYRVTIHLRVPVEACTGVILPTDTKKKKSARAMRMDHKL